ncbi:MAG: type II toxin-antitoxin system Phd/YefM family antitoxin [Proteobacteria bacterium]|jgi:hypothetical protein|nr:type II toxin-antitoxin system Phd/YefM family antitoxin [Pseudomonadota bacterium]
MKFVSTRELRNTPGKVRELLEDDDLVLTANGKPVGILLGVGDGELDATAALVKRVRAQMAVARLRAEAFASGAASMDVGEIDDEIRAARKARPDA